MMSGDSRHATQLPQEIFEQVLSLNYMAGQMRTLISCCQHEISSIKTFASKHGGGDFAEWQNIDYLLSMLDDKTDAVEDIATAVRNA